MMKNIQFKKLILVLGIFTVMLTYFQFRKNISEDYRVSVQATHNCSWFAGKCGGTCDVGYYCSGYDAASCECLRSPTATRRPSPTPTTESLLLCDDGSDGDKVCSALRPVTCEKTSCSYSNCVDGTATKCVKCRQVGCPGGYCSESCGIPDSILCGYCVGENTPTPTQPPDECQVTDCDNICGLGGCSDNCGSQDNCGGVDCDPCGGVTTAPGITPTNAPVNTPTKKPTCSPTCKDDPCRTNLCSDQICIGTCGGNCVGALTCNTPSLSSLLIKNTDGVVVNPDGDSRNHICENIFTTSTNPREVTFEVNVHDEDGYTNISSVEMEWAGIGYTMNFDSGLAKDALYTKTIDFGDEYNNEFTYYINIKITDANNKTTGWIGERQWKVWDCNVSVSGSLFDGSAGQLCNTTGFSTYADNSLNYSSLFFRDALGGGISATAYLPNSFGETNLIWGRNYLPIFNGGDVANPNGTLSATGRMTRIVDLGMGTTSCPNMEEFDFGTKVSAYSISPSVNIDFSFIKSQESWFQVVGAGIKAKNQISSGVPITAPAAIRALTLSKALVDNGLVSFASFTNINGFNESSGYGLTNNWWINRSTNDTTTYNYQYFYNNLFVNRGMGATGSDWASKPSEGIYYVNGNLTIDSDFTLAAGKTLLVVVRGAITISDTVDRVDGIFIADGGINALGSSANQLVINGVLYSKNNIQLSRSYTDKLQNNTNPAVVINYQPNLIFSLPGTVMRVLSGWRVE